MSEEGAVASGGDAPVAGGDAGQSQGGGSIISDAGGAPAAQPSTAAPQQSNDFRSSWPEEYRTEPMFKNISTQEDLLKMAQNAQRLIGADKNVVLKIPNEGSDPSEWDKIYSQLGRPESPEKYTRLEAKEGEVALDKEFVDRIAAAAHRKGVSDEGFLEIQKEYAAMAKEDRDRAIEQGNQFVDHSKGQLKEKWGAAYNDRINMVKDAIQVYGGERLQNILEITGAINYPEVAHAFSELGQAVRESGAYDGGKTGSYSGSQAMTPDQAKMRKKELAGNKDWQERYRKGDKAAVEEMQRLNNYIYGEKPRAATYVH